MKYHEKLEKLDKIVMEYERMAVAFSGGVDSTFLLLYGKKVLGDQVMAVTASAPNFAPDEISYARELCKKEDINHMIMDLGENILDSFSHNPPDRCYICKKSIFTQMKERLLEVSPDAVLVDGTNADDARDYRPGRKALDELQIASPLKEVGLTKDEIRRGLKDLGGDIWNKPPFACLASRIPYGEAITSEKMYAVYKAESALHDLGFEQIRVRHHGSVARIEVTPRDREKFFSLSFMDKVNEAVKSAGFLHVSLDLAGYRMGSLNEDILTGR